MPLDADDSAHLIDLAGTPVFGARLLEIASGLAGIEEVFGYAVDENGARPLVSASRLEHQDIRVKEYARRFYRQDPTVHGARDVALHAGFSKNVRSTQIAQNDYRRICFDEPRFAGKACFGWRGPNHTLVLNFYRREEADEQTFRDLSSLADLCLAAINRRLAPRVESQRLELLEQRLGAEFPLLAARERQVIARTLLGKNSGEIAQALGTSRGTVLTYRQRAYQKYSASSASGFLARLI